MKKCTNCGATLNDNVKFCPECGFAFKETTNNAPYKPYSYYDPNDQHHKINSVYDPNKENNDYQNQYDGSKLFDTKNKSEEVAASQARKSIVRGILSIVFSNFAFPVGMIIGLVLSNNARRFAKWVFDECPNSPSVAKAKIGKKLGDIGTMLSLASIFVFFIYIFFMFYLLTA